MKDVDDALAKGVNCFVVVGDASVLVERAVARIVAWGKQRCGPPAFNLSVVYANEAGAALVAARTLPMMAPLRVVVVKELESGSEEMMASLAGYLEDPSPTTLLVACGTSYPKVKKGGSNWPVKMPKALASKGGKLIRLDSSSVRPEHFAQEHAKSIGKQMSLPDARLLVATVGADLGLLVQEVEKLAAYVGDAPKIDAIAIGECSCMVAEAVTWDLTNGIAAGNPEMALTALHRMTASGESCHKLLGLVVYQYRQILQVAEYKAKGLSAGGIADALGMRSDDQAARIMRSIGDRRIDAAGLLERLARANEAMNSHRAGDQAVFEQLVVELVSGTTGHQRA